MKYQEQGAGRSGDYGQTLQRSGSRKAACPSRLRRKQLANIVKILAHSAGYALRIFPSIPTLSGSNASQKYCRDRF
jgi:hypothetical protein